MLTPSCTFVGTGMSPTQSRSSTGGGPPERLVAVDVGEELVAVSEQVTDPLDDIANVLMSTGDKNTYNEPTWARMATGSLIASRPKTLRLSHSAGPEL